MSVCIVGLSAMPDDFFEAVKKVILQYQPVGHVHTEPVTLTRPEFDRLVMCALAGIEAVYDYHRGMSFTKELERTLNAMKALDDLPTTSNHNKPD